MSAGREGGRQRDRIDKEKANQCCERGGGGGEKRRRERGAEQHNPIQSNPMREEEERGRRGKREEGSDIQSGDQEKDGSGAGRRWKEEAQRRKER